VFQGRCRGGGIFYIVININSHMMQGHEIIMQRNFHIVTTYDSRNIRRMKFNIGSLWGRNCLAITVFHNITNIHVLKYSDKFSDGRNFCCSSQLCTNCTIAIIGLGSVITFICKTFHISTLNLLIYRSCETPKLHSIYM